MGDLVKCDSKFDELLPIFFTIACRSGPEVIVYVVVVEFLVCVTPDQISPVLLLFLIKGLKTSQPY